MIDWQWFALKCAPQRELAMAQVLREDGRDVFVPIKHVMVRPNPKSRRKVLRAMAQYPGYLFLGLAPGAEADWMNILRFRALHGVIGLSGLPTAIKELSMIPMLAGCRRPKNYINLPGSRGKRRDKSQRTARIVNGPYQDKTVRVIETDEGDYELYELFNAA